MNPALADRALWVEPFSRAGTVDRKEGRIVLLIIDVGLKGDRAVIVDAEEGMAGVECPIDLLAAMRERIQAAD